MGSGPSTYDPGEIVTMAWDRANNMSDTVLGRVDQYIGQAVAASNESATMQPSTLTFQPAVTRPNVNIPAQAEANLLQLFGSQWRDMMDSLSGQFRDFIAKYLPDDSGAFQAAEAWLKRSIVDGGTGINAAVEDQVWQRDRARLLRESSRQQAELVSGFAARGFPLPGGVAVAALARVQQDTNDKIAQASRDAAIKSFDAELENVRFAVEKAISLRTAAMDAARGYIAAMASTAGVAAQVVPSVTDTQARLIAAASDYWRAGISAEELRLRAALPNVEMQQQASKSNLDAKMRSIEVRANALMEAAKALAVQAAATLNSLHVSSSTSAGSSNGVSYSYSNTTQTKPYTKEW